MSSPDLAPDASTPAAKAPRSAWIGVAVLGAAALLVSIDVFVLLLAMPAISDDLGASGIEQLWILDIYGFLLAGFLVTMGALGDRIGRRRMLLIGAAAFTVASVVAAFSTSPAMLIVARAALGIAGATLAPSTLGLISSMFSDAKERGLAIGLWMMCFMGGAVLGPVVGGVLLEQFWWGSAFLIGVPVMVVVLVVGPRVLPEHRDPDPGPLDLVGVGLSLAAALPAVYGIKQLAIHGADAPAVAALLIGVAFGIVFARRQLSIAHPLIDLSLFRNASFATAVGSMFLVTVLGSAMYFVTQYLQLVRDMSPLEAGLVSLPAVACAPIGFGLSPVVARRVRPAVLIPVGLSVTATGALLMLGAGLDDTVLVVLGYALFQLGCGPVVTLSTGLVVGTAPVEKAGAASAVSETSAELGYSVGLATVGTLGTAIYRDRLGAPAGLDGGQAETAREGLAGAVATARDLPADVAAPLLDAAREAFLGGFHAMAIVVAATCVVLGAINAWFHRDVPPLGANSTD